MENLSRRIHIKPVESYHTGTLKRFQTKSALLTFKLYGNLQCFAFKTKTDVFEKLSCLSFCGLNFCKLHLRKTFYKNLKPNLEI